MEQLDFLDEVERKRVRGLGTEFLNLDIERGLAQPEGMDEERNLPLLLRTLGRVLDLFSILAQESVF